MERPLLKYTPIGKQISGANFLAYTFERLWVVGSQGKFGMGLEDIPEIYRGELTKFSPVYEEEPGLSALRGVKFDPFIHCEFYHYQDPLQDTKDTIIAYSLNERDLKEFCGDLPSRLGWSAFPITEEFDNFLYRIMREREARIYINCQGMAHGFMRDLEEPFKVVQYSQFLTKCGVGSEESLDMARKELGIPEFTSTSPSSGDKSG
jgi:hypothetical protein